MRPRLPTFFLASTAAAALGCLTAPEASAGPSRNLGLICTIASDCPGGHECIRLLGVGSQTDGFCSIACAGGDLATCADGYAGPGYPVCSSDRCVIQCTTPGDPGQCPAGLACLESAPQAPSYCVRPP